jgi:hypothetical protein
MNLRRYYHLVPRQNQVGLPSDPDKALLTFGAGARLHFEAEGHNSDVGGDSQQNMLLGRFG